MEFFAHNGFYEEERKIGNRYAVDVEIETNFNTASETDDLSKTINYEVIYKIVEHQIHQESKLLEHIVFNINNALIAEFGTIAEVRTTVCKHNPPFGGLCDKVCISDILKQN